MRPETLTINTPQLSKAAAIVIKKYSGRRRLFSRLFELVLRPLVWFSESSEPISLDQVSRIVVFEPGSLGDIVMLIPVLQSLRARFAAAKIYFLCRQSGPKKGQEYSSINQLSIQTLLVAQGYVDEIIPLPVPWLLDVSVWKKYNPFSLHWPRFVSRVRQLRGYRFDLAIPGGRSDIRANFVMWLSGAKRRVGYGYAGGDFLLSDVAVPDMQRPHQTELSLQLLEHLGIPLIRGQRMLKTSTREEEFAEEFLRSNGIETDDLVVGIHPGSRVPTRQWGELKFREIARQIVRNHHAKVIWFGEPGNSGEVFESLNIIPASFALRDFLAILAKCRLLVCNESGPMHLAAAVQIPVVTVFGSGFPEWFHPLGENHRIVIRRDMWCRPCGDNCIFDQPYCLNLIPVEQVMHEVEAALESRPHSLKPAEARR
jgi:ADP-heptose:LPS heptosyltransferase